jgi:hypothetical protein
LVAWLARKIVKSNADAAADVAEVLRERALALCPADSSTFKWRKMAGCAISTA